MRTLLPILATLLLTSSATVATARPVASMTGTYDSSGATTENARFDGLARDGSDLSLRTTANVRLTSRHAALPAIIAGFSATWTQGPMILGAAWAGRFIGTLGTTPAAARSGEPEPQGDGRYGWSLYDAGPELKLAWTLGRFRPYVGAGFDLVYGRLDSLGAEERPGSEDPRGQGRLSDDRSPLESMNPTRFLVRPHAGVDIAFGRSSLGLQADYAMLSTGGGSRPPRETGPGVLIVTAAFRGTF